VTWAQKFSGDLFPKIQQRPGTKTTRLDTPSWLSRLNYGHSQVYSHPTSKSTTTYCKCNNYNDNEATLFETVCEVIHTDPSKGYHLIRDYRA